MWKSLTLGLLTLFNISVAAPLSSVYTPLEFGKCKMISQAKDDGGSTVDLCPGMAGYALVLEEGDLRQNVQVIAPGGRKYSLDLWTLVSSGFSSTGPRAEWRMAGKVPKALIVRYNASETPENPNKITSYLAVAKIGSSGVCLVAKIQPGVNMNLEARHISDRAGAMKCLQAP